MLHGITFQKIEFFMVAGVRTSNPTLENQVYLISVADIFNDSL
jgi:hypothetical protein